jgi:hypothetical protein
MSNEVIPRISSLLKVRNNLNLGVEDGISSEKNLGSEVSLVNNAILESNTELTSKELNISQANLNKELVK